MKKNLKIIIGILLLSFIFIMLLVVTNCTKTFDSAIYNFVISFRCKFLDNYFKFITMFGNTNAIIIALGLLVLIFHNKKGLVLAISTFSCVIINSLVKHIIRRNRPTVIHLVKQGGYSFPSGHTMIAICLNGYLLYLVRKGSVMFMTELAKNIKNDILKNTLSIILIILIISICLSRIYVGVHFATDVLAGLFLGLTILILVIYYTNKYLKGD